MPTLHHSDPADSPARCPASSARHFLAVTGWGFLAALAYFVAGDVGLSLPYLANQITLIWPPTGISVFVLLCWGRRYWPGVFLGALALNLIYSPLIVAMEISIGNTLGPLLAATLLKKFRFQNSLSSNRDIIIYVGCAALLSMLIPALCGSTALWLNGIIPDAQWSEAFLIWWFGDSCGVLLFGPVLILLPGQLRRWRNAPRQILSSATCLMIAGLISTIVFTGLTPLGREPGLPISFLPYILIALVVVISQAWTAAAVVAVVSTIAAIGTAGGYGPFGHLDMASRMLFVWCYMVVSMLLTLITIVANNQRDQAIRDLTERDAEYSTLIEFSPVLMVRYGTDRRITFVNEAVSLTTGLPRKKIIGQPIDEFLPPPTGASRRRQASGFGNVIPAMSFEIEHQVAERLLQIRWVVRELHDDAGNVTETHCVGIDLTEQKQAEERRRVFEEQLVQVQKLESLGILAGGIAHDFNNLLAAMGGFAELAERHLPANHAARPALTGVRDAVDRAAGLARQMLAYAGKGQTTEHVAIDLNHELHGTLRLTAAALSKNVTVQLELHPSLPCVFGDVTQIRQVLLNLIINAGEAIGDSPGRLTIRTALYQLSADELGESVIDRELSPGEYIRVDVIDTGCGMDEATKERIFDPFFTTKFTGRGLGLASVLGIVRGHKGTVRVKSRKNVGTNFSILLPADRTRTVPSPASAVPAAIAPAGQKRGPTALVVDDEQSIRMITTQMLEQLGWSVVTAADGCEAIDVFRSDSEKFNVVLLDMTMPKMNGQEVYQELRRIRREVPVIVCSGYSQDSMNFTSDAQAPQFLPKPFRFDDLKRAVAAAI